MLCYITIGENREQGLSVVVQSSSTVSPQRTGYADDYWHDCCPRRVLYSCKILDCVYYYSSVYILKLFATATRCTSIHKEKIAPSAEENPAAGQSKKEKRSAGVIYFLMLRVTCVYVDFLKKKKRKKNT